MPNPLETLLNMNRKPRLMGAPDSYQDPSLGVDEFNVGMQGELRDRIFAAERTAGMPGSAPGEVGALKGLLGSYKQERAASPLAQQGQVVDAQQLGNLDAQNEGFGGGPGQTPMQAREIYRRGQAEAKQNQPLEIANINADAEKTRQGMISDTGRYVADKQNEAAIMNAGVQKGYYDSITGGGTKPIDPNQIKSVNKTGVSFQTTRPQASTVPLQRDLKDAREYLTTSPFENFHGNAPEQQAYAQAVNNLVASSKLSPESRIEFMNIIRNPQYADVDSIQLLDSLFERESDPVEFAEMLNLLLQVKGR